MYTGSTVSIYYLLQIKKYHITTYVQMDFLYLGTGKVNNFNHVVQSRSRNDKLVSMVN